ncbi:M24 family metallopeptidase [Virgibacillus halophilus]|uniref:M24 family metallopeptidase n=1 Tax=Tigheibacillus halophilus TaxID=361280 RepID=UPI00363B7701
MTERLENLLKQMKTNNMDSVLVTSPANVYYLSNYNSDPHERLLAIFVCQHEDPLLILPAMEEEDAKNAGWKFPTIAYYDHEDPWEMFRLFLQKRSTKINSIALESNQVTLERYLKVKEIFPQAEMMNAEDSLAGLRLIKNKKEYTLLKQAAALADLGVRTGVAAIQEGVSEFDLIATIEYTLKKEGIQGMSFSTMALSGDKTASPHGTPGAKKIEKGDMVLFDLGVIYEGYCSDITRTVAYKSVTDQQRTIYETVRTAQQKAIDASQLGTAVGAIDRAARTHIQEAGYGDYFKHRIGHGLGIETHEYPSMHENNQLQLQPGMCYTIEPGIYVPNQGGVRIEDMIFMTEKGAEILTEYPKELLVLD